MKLIRPISLVLLCIAFVPSIVFADPLTYKVEGETVAVIGCDKNATGELVIPSIYEVKPVTRIGYNAFFESIGLTSITIPSSVIIIDSYAFSHCSFVNDGDFYH